MFISLDALAMHLRHWHACTLIGVPHQQPTPEAQIEGAINALHSKRKEWANLGCKERASLLRRCVETTLKVPIVTQLCPVNALLIAVCFLLKT